MKGVVDLNKYREIKERKERKNKPDPNTELFKKLIAVPVKELEPDQYEAYAEIEIRFVTIFREIHKVVVVEFRGKFYVINTLNGGKFEYLGEFNEILDRFI